MSDSTVSYSFLYLTTESFQDRERTNESRVSQVSSVTSYRSILTATPFEPQITGEAPSNQPNVPSRVSTKCARISARTRVRERVYTHSCILYWACVIVPALGGTERYYAS